MTPVRRKVAGALALAVLSGAVGVVSAAAAAAQPLLVTDERADGGTETSHLTDGLPAAEDPAGPSPTVDSAVAAVLDDPDDIVPVIIRPRDQAGLSAAAAQARTAGTTGRHDARVGARSAPGPSRRQPGKRAPAPRCRSGRRASGRTSAPTGSSTGSAPR